MSIDLLPVAPATMSDTELQSTARVLGEKRRQVDAALSIIADELKRRSRPELGHDGLAQKLGLRTGERLVQQVTGVSAREAVALVKVGEITAPPSADSSPDLPSWLGSVGDAVRSGELTVTAADVIRSGLGAPQEGVPAEALALAAVELVSLAPTVTVEQLASYARQTRDLLDEAGIEGRAAALREARYLHLVEQRDGSTRVSGVLDPESAAIVRAAYDAATSPRRGGPRFVDEEDRARAEALQADSRTTAQIAIDTFVELIRIGSAVDPGNILPTRRPEVVVRVTLQDLERRAGFGRLDGQTSPVGIPAVERQICETGIIPILFDGPTGRGRVVDVGRSQRLFTRKQRIALAERDGGCQFPDCDRPPSWTEAHHITWWSKGGGTSIDNGILLCRHHHLLVHDHGWNIRRDPHPESPGSNGWIIEPPPAVIRA